MRPEYFRKKEIAGAMRHRVGLLEPVYAPNAFGEKVKTYASPVEVWANIKFKTTGSDERTEMQRTTAFSNVEVFIRFRADLQPQWRLEYRGNSYNIKAVLPDEKNAFMLLECELDEPITSN